MALEPSAVPFRSNVPIRRFWGVVVRPNITSPKLPDSPTHDWRLKPSVQAPVSLPISPSSWKFAFRPLPRSSEPRKPSFEVSV